MLEGLPPNNAAHRLTLVTDERRARAVADLIVESFEPAEAASTAFETEDAWPGGGKAWLVEAYFGVAPDEDDIRALIAAAAARRRRAGSHHSGWRECLGILRSQRPAVSARAVPADQRIVRSGGPDGQRGAGAGYSAARSITSIRDRGSTRTSTSGSAPKKTTSLGNICSRARRKFDEVASYRFRRAAQLWLTKNC